MLQHEWNLKTLGQMKEDSRERLHIVWFYLYKMSITDNLIGIEIRLIIA